MNICNRTEAAADANLGQIQNRRKESRINTRLPTIRKFIWLVKKKKRHQSGSQDESVELHV